MQANIWYELGIGFAAFKAICKGLQSKFTEINSINITHFGSKTDNYPYFNTLLSHLDYKDHIDSMALVKKKKKCVKTTFILIVPKIFLDSQ